MSLGPSVVGESWPDLSPLGDRPYIWINCASSLDGRLAFAQGKQARLSSIEDLRRVQRLRLRVDAILVGVGTVIADDPSLRVHRELLGEDPSASHDGMRSGPLRIVLDSHGRTPENSQVLDGKQPTVVLTVEGVRRRFPPSVTVGGFGRGRIGLKAAMRWLLKRGTRSILVEGGSEVISSFVREGLVDRWTLYTAPIAIGGRTAPTVMSGPDGEGPEAHVRFRLLSAEKLGDGLLSTYEPVRGPPNDG